MGPPSMEWRWFVTDLNELKFSPGYKGYGGVWNFKGHEVSDDHVYLTEKAAIKAAKDRLKETIANCKRQLEALNKRGK